MRCFPALLLLASSFGLAAEDAPLDPRVQRILDDYREELVEAADDYREEVAEAREDAVRDLKRQVRSSTPLPERVAIMREVLRIAREDEEARAFFQTLGTLESELAALGGSPDQALAVDLLAPASNPAQGSLRALVEASPAAMALMASLESEPNAPIHAAYAGVAEDQVGRGTQATPDGHHDGRIDLLVTTALGTVERIDVLAKGRWTTKPGGSWILGVSANGKRVDEGKQAPVTAIDGPTLLSCYAAEAGRRWRPGATVRVMLVCADGTRHDLTVEMPGAGATTAASRR